MNEFKKLNQVQGSVFEKMKKTNESGMEFWSARDFQSILDYKEWRKFSGVIDRKSTRLNSSH